MCGKTNLRVYIMKWFVYVFRGNTFAGRFLSAWSGPISSLNNFSSEKVALGENCKCQKVSETRETPSGSRPHRSQNGEIAAQLALSA